MLKKKGKKGKKAKGKSKKNEQKESRIDRESEIEMAKSSASLWESRLDTAEQSRAEYREAVHKLAQANEELAIQHNHMEKDTFEIIALLNVKDAEKDAKITQLEEQLREQRKKAREESEQLVNEFTLRTMELEEKFQKRSREFQMIQEELKMIKEFRQKKTQMERELSELKEKIYTDDREYKESLARMEHKFFSEKLHLEKEAEQQVARMAERAHNEAIVQLDDVSRTVFKENVRLSEAVRYHIKEVEELRKTSAALAAEKEELALYKETSELMATQNVSQLKQQREEIALLRGKVATLEQALGLMAFELEREKRDGKRQALAGTEAGRAELDRLRKSLEAQEREMKRIKLLARSMLDQRTELERFFQDALQQVRQEIQASRAQYQQAALLAYQQRMSEARAGRQEYPHIRTFRKSRYSTNSVYADLEEAEKWSHLKGAKVDISELTWEQKEKVLRLLFAKMNGLKARRPALLPALPEHENRISDPRPSEEPVNGTFITQAPVSTLSSSVSKLPDIQTT